MVKSSLEMVEELNQESEVLKLEVMGVHPFVNTPRNQSEYDKSLSRLKNDNKGETNEAI
ncbi:hypothetical protein D3C75_1332870 [compost metagenome]